MQPNGYIRSTPVDVFQAIVDPAVTTRIWYTKSSSLKALLEQDVVLGLVADAHPADLNK